MIAEQNGEQIATYAESPTITAGLARCQQEFPADEGYSNHYLIDIETGEEFP